MLNNVLFGPIKQWGFLVKNLDQTIQGWGEGMAIEQMMFDASGIYAQQVPDCDSSQQCQLVCL